MPSLIRLMILLLFLAGLGYAGMFALSVLVDPGEEQITIRIPARQFQANNPAARGNAPRPIVDSETEAEADAPANDVPVAPATADVPE